MQQRRGTQSQWDTANPTLAAGEIGFETDNNRFKIGDGATAWASLDYFANSAALSDLLDGAPDALNTLNELAAAIGDDAAFFSTINNTVDAHTSATTNVHGIEDTSLLVDTDNLNDSISTALSEHNSETTSVHGIADTSLLATTADTATAIDDAITAEALVTAGNLLDHNVATTNVHGILDTADLATLTDVANAVAESVVNQEGLAGVGIDWNSEDEQFDIDSTVATKTYADDAVSTHNSDTTSVHGIADTAELETQTGAQAKADLAQGAAEDYADGLAVNYDAAGSATAAQSAAEATAASLYATKIAPAITGNATAENLTISGNLVVQGTTATLNATDLEVQDPLIYMSVGQWTTDATDLGFLAAYGTVGGTEQDHNHSGLFRDVSDSGKWKLVSDVPHPVGNEVDITSATYDTLKLGGVEFSDGTQSKEGVPSRTPIVQKTASYALSTLTHRDSMIEVSSTSGTTITIPAEASVNYPVGTTIDILQTNTGQVTIAGAAGVTVNATPGLKLRTRWSSATLMKRAADTWVVYGDLTA